MENKWKELLFCFVMLHLFLFFLLVIQPLILKRRLVPKTRFLRKNESRYTGSYGSGKKRLRNKNHTLEKTKKRVKQTETGTGRENMFDSIHEEAA